MSKGLKKLFEKVFFVWMIHPTDNGEMMFILGKNHVEKQIEIKIK